MSSADNAAPIHTNKLIDESSPYLLQHAHNPVMWHAWGEEALAVARNEDKPILLSIGYSACHWCHVMERESFENEAIAALMNANFVCIKVDREERPDLDTIYMNAVQLMTGQGGWPMTVFLTPNCVPFYGGTYYPPEDRHGMPGFPRILAAIADAYHNRRQDIERGAQGLLTELSRLSHPPQSEGELSKAILDNAAARLLAQLDHRHGGFGSKPKFPPAMNLSFLLRQYHRTGQEAALAAVKLTLDEMASGGIYDQLGGGFHRYSVDERWLVPHFEKMLYDNALLSRTYVEAFLVTGNRFYERIATETLDYVQREMTDPSGGFYSTQDADSEGEEGKFFVWTPEEITKLLGEEDAALFNRYFDVSTEGNFEGHNILHVDESMEVIGRLLQVAPERIMQAVARARPLLFQAREQRVKPGRDEKVLAAWNGLMLRSFAEASSALGRGAYRQTAQRNAEFLVREMKRDGRLLRTWKDGKAKLNAYLEDYAFVIDGLLSLYEASFDVLWFREARDLAEIMIDQFWDEEHGAFFLTSRDHEPLITRTKDIYDNAIPSGNSVAVHALFKLALLTGEERYRRPAEATLAALAPAAQRAPSGFGELLCGLDFFLSSPFEIAIVGEPGTAETTGLMDVVLRRFEPNKAVAFAAPDNQDAISSIRLLEGRGVLSGRATAYVCRNYQCEKPVSDAASLRAQLDARVENG